MREIDLSRIKRVLLVRVDEIGDVVLTTPLIRELRKNLPHAWITLVVKPEVYNLIETCPYVNEVLVYDWNVCGQKRNLIRHFRILKLALLRLWKRNFDLAILPRWDCDYYHSSFLAYLSGAKARVAYSEEVTTYKRMLNKGYDKLFTHVLTDNYLKHEVEHNLEVITFLRGNIDDDRLELWVDKEDERSAQALLNKDEMKKNVFFIDF